MSSSRGQQGTSRGQQGSSQAQQEALQREEYYSTEPSRRQAAEAMERQKDRQAGQKALRKNARADAYDSLRPAQGRLTIEQQYQQSRQQPQPEYPSEQFRRPLLEPDEELRGTRAYETQVDRRRSEQRMLRQIFAESAASSANVFTPSERQDIMDRSGRDQKERETEREQRTRYFRRDG